MNAPQTWSVVPDYLPAPDTTSLLVPGAHTDGQGEYREVSTFAFANQALMSINYPGGALGRRTVWRRGGIPGELQGSPGARRFMPWTRQQARLTLDRCCRLVRWSKVKVESEERGPRGGARQEEQHVELYQTATGDHGDMLIACAATNPAVDEIEHLVNYPVFTRSNFQISIPGYRVGVFYDEPASLGILNPIEDAAIIRGILYDLTVDFPFASEADRANLYGLLLTPLLRPAINGNVPMHLITSPIERTGKTKLAEEVIGGVILGEPTPALQLTGNDDERDKRVLALLLSGQTLAHLDNLGEFLDSPVLASLLTSSRYQGRMLGVSQMVTVRNAMTLVASGNNVRATGEIAKRIVPIQLASLEEHPEHRTGFRHHDLRAYVREQRPRVLEALLGAVELWRTAGRPEGRRTMGGFEEWSRVMGGIMGVLGYDEWLGNADEWRDEADEFSEHLGQLVDAWARVHGTASVPPAKILEIAKGHDLFPWIFAARTDKGAETAFGRKVLQRAVRRVVGGHGIRSDSGRNGRVYSLVPCKSEG